MAPVKVLLLGSLTVALLLATFASAQKPTIASAPGPTSAQGIASAQGPALSLRRDADFIETLEAASSSALGKSFAPICPNTPCQVCQCGDKKKKFKCRVYYYGYYCQDYPSGTMTPDGGRSWGCSVLSGPAWLPIPKNYRCLVTRWQFCEATVPAFCADLP